jgi:hypothetical protein
LPQEFGRLLVRRKYESAGEHVPKLVSSHPCAKLQKTRRRFMGLPDMAFRSWLH